MEDEKIIALIEGYGAGTLSEEETIVFFQWYSEASLEAFNRLFAQCKLQPGNLPAYPAIPDNFRLQLEQAIREQEANEEQYEGAQGRLVPLFRRRWGWAAAILLLISVGGYVFYNSRQGDPTGIVNNQPSSNDVAPGTTKAVLTLADGRQVTIDSAQTGQLAMQGKTMVQHDQGAISYNGNTSEKTQPSVQPLLYNTLTTSRGEQSPPLILSDGTKVWLNALSSIRFPVAFTGNARNVEITGEAFFEVTKNASKPFHVTVKDMEVEVLGTQFNVNAYDDETSIKTTLLEGKVKVGNRSRQRAGATGNQPSAILMPGQQAQMLNNQLSVINDPNIDQVMAWKNGLFDFNHVNLQTVLQQLSRWYDIEVKFEGTIPARTFRGKITRDLSLSQVIQVLQDVDVKLRIEGKTLFVTSH